MEQLCVYNLESYIEPKSRIEGKVFIPEKVQVQGYYEALNKLRSEEENFVKTIQSNEFQQLSPEEKGAFYLEGGPTSSSYFTDIAKRKLKKVIENPSETLEKYLKVARSHRNAVENYNRIFKNEVEPNIPGKIIIWTQPSILFDSPVYDITLCLIQYRPKAFIGRTLGLYEKEIFDDAMRSRNIKCYYFGVGITELEKFNSRTGKLTWEEI